MSDKYRQESKDHERHDHVGKPSLLDRIFGLLEGPVATILVKLLATGIICATTVALAGIMALASFSFSAILSTVGLGMLTTGIIWIFAGWKRNPQPNAQKLQDLNAQINELEERLRNVEIIERFEDRLAGQVRRQWTEIEEQKEETTHETSTSVSEASLF
ncbi:MAG: hypothetical protein ACJAVK_002855 [Akkermansiaceae bacterium]|jgi:hypothetical protein